MKPSINKKLNLSIEKQIFGELLKELKDINSVSGLNNFFNKFFTDYEKRLIFRRIAAMKLIDQNKKYLEIKNILSVSANTISKAKDILEGRRYSIDPNRKRKYSSLSNPKKIIKKRRLRYKGTSGVLDPFA